jgi:glycine betaine/proline transport system substrate-binding protein
MILKRAFSAITVAGALAAASFSPARAAESSEPIRIAVNEWTGQHLSAYIAGDLLKKMGYEVEMVTAGGLPQFTAIARGDLHANPEVWDNSVTDIYTNGLASGDLVNLGKLGLEPRDGWIYPPYMEEKCPGLPSYKALFDCAQAFASAETFPKGRVVAYPADWGTRTQDLVAAIDIPFVPIAGGSEGAMIAELKGAMDSKEPILMMFWQPHWIFANLDVKWVEWAPTEGECVAEKQTRENACGFSQASVDKIVSKSFPEKWPRAAAFMKAFTLTNDEQNRMIYEVDQQGRKLHEVVQEWIVDNETQWSGWIKQ